VASLNRAERRELEARLRADAAALDTRIEELWVELDGMEGIELHKATMERLAAEGWPSERVSDLGEQLYELENYESYGERVGNVLMGYVLWVWFFLFVVAAVLRATRVISHGETLAAVWLLGSVAIVALAWLTTSIGDRQGW
jgi:hypothetical protein